MEEMFVCLLFYTRATVSQLYHGGDMIYEMTRRKSEATLLQTQGIFDHPHCIGMVGEELAINDAVSYTQYRNGLQPT